MIDSDELNRYIESRKRFKIGTRGICINCIPHLHNAGWTVSIPRAFVYLDVCEINVLDDVDFYHLCVSFDDGHSFESVADLTQYDKLTVI